MSCKPCVLRFYSFYILVKKAIENENASISIAFFIAKVKESIHMSRK